ncbi:MAG TPA: hypothetical protein VM101_11000 [Flavitalea sp.]|nr:hypothetical protein [Flavitalea sp.]
MKLLLLLASLFLKLSFSFAQTTININLSDTGRTFEGIGALSAGASTRLLIDYPDSIRGHILDFLFKPKFGASLQHLKVEIGGDVNSTCGTEPSHARTREEFDNPKPQYFHRGYEWWLMTEAKKRNPDIFLDCLEWGAPGWIGDGKYYSQDNIKYIISFIKGAKQYHNLKIDFTGIWNERMYDIEFIKNLRQALDENDLKDVQIVAADQCCDNQKWLVAEHMKTDEDLRKSVSVIGDHYPERDQKKAYHSTEQAKSFGIPIWNNEGGPWKGDWKAFSYLAKMYNRDYIEGAMTKNITWSLITSYYDNLSLPNSGLMTANTPWSGNYKVEPAIWAVAHTTQFADPGWKYVNSGCGYFPDKGSYVTLASPSSEQLSIIAETMDARVPQKIKFRFKPGTKVDKIYVWRSTMRGEIFKELKAVNVKNNEFIITLDPKALYSLTTTTGQQKGPTQYLKNKHFPFPYKAEFDEEKLAVTPKYFSDMGGAFEVAERKDHKGKCLRQVIRNRGIEWEEPVYNQTILGDTMWKDYSATSDVFFQESYSYATIFVRAMEMHRSHKLPEGYILKLQSSGLWELFAGSKRLARGKVSLDILKWQTISIETKGRIVQATINGKVIAKVADAAFSHGIAGIGSSFHVVDFDNFSIAEPGRK